MSHSFDLMDSISIIRFLYPLKIACDNERVHEEAASWFIFFLVKELEDAALTARLSLKITSSHSSVKDGMCYHFTSRSISALYDLCHRLYHYRSKHRKSTLYAADKHISLYHADTLWMRTFYCTQAYHEYVSKLTLVKGLMYSIDHSNYCFWTKNKHGALQILDVNPHF